MRDDVFGQRKKRHVVDALDILLNGFETVIEKRGRQSGKTCHVSQSNLAMAPHAADDGIQFLAFEISECHALVHSVDDKSQSPFVEVQHGLEGVRGLFHAHFVGSRWLRGRPRTAIAGVVIDIFGGAVATGTAFATGAAEATLASAAAPDVGHVVVVDEFGIVKQTIGSQLPSVALGIGSDERLISVAVQRGVFGGDADDGVRASMSAIPSKLEEMHSAAVGDFATSNCGIFVYYKTDINLSTFLLFLTHAGKKMRKQRQQQQEQQQRQQ